MTHILQFAVDIDDEKIKSVIIEEAKKKVLATVVSDVEEVLCSELCYIPRSDRGKNLKGLRDMVNDQVTKIIESHKDKIIELASDKLAERLARSKKVVDTLVEDKRLT